MAGDIASTVFQPLGTVMMRGGDAPTSVVDSRLRVRGVDGPRVNDASVMAVITSGKTSSPVLLIAGKTARWIRDENGHGD